VGPQVIFGAANHPRPVGGPARGPADVRLGQQPGQTSEALLLDQQPGPGEGVGSGLGQVEQTDQVRPQGAAAGRACGDHLLAGQALLRVKPAKHRHPLSNEAPVHYQGHQLIAVGRRHMVRLLARVEHPDLARLQAPAAPDGVFVRGQDGKAAKAAGGRPTLDVNHPVDDDPEDLSPSQLEELKAAPERPAAELPETKAPPRERSGQLVEVTGAQRLQQHRPSPVAMCPRRQFAVFRLDCSPAAHTLEELDEKRPHEATSLKSVPEGSPP
jgi:hypothetical protein